MCTLSIIPLDPLESAIRLVCNRDELRTRAEALAPRIKKFAGRRALMPIDPASGGTWIAVNDAGIIFTLLNRNAAGTLSLNAGMPAPATSRGRIIPALLHCESVSEATEAAVQIRPLDSQPFRLVILDTDSFAEVVSDGRMLRTYRRPFDGVPLLFTSSGLGDDLVEKPRRALFDQMIRSAKPTPQAQDAFHHHFWADARHLSVCMSREEARTVSRTTIELIPGVARMRYEPVRDDAGAVRGTGYQPVTQEADHELVARATVAPTDRASLEMELQIPEHT